MENNEVSQDYLKGFNQGYYIQQNNPELSESITNNMDADSEYYTGFTDGGKEYEMERISSEMSQENEGQDASEGMER